MWHRISKSATWQNYMYSVYHGEKSLAITKELKFMEVLHMGIHVCILYTHALKADSISHVHVQYMHVQLAVETLITPFIESFGWPMLECIEHKALEQLLIGHPHFDRVPRRTVLLIPRLDQRDIKGSSTTP